MDQCVVEHVATAFKPAPVESAVTNISATNIATKGAASLQADTTQVQCVECVPETTTNTEPVSAVHPPQEGETLRQEHGSPKECIIASGQSSLEAKPPSPFEHSSFDSSTQPAAAGSVFEADVQLSTNVHVSQPPTAVSVTESSHLSAPSDKLTPLPPSEPVDPSAPSHCGLTGQSHVVAEEINGLTHKAITRSPSLHANEEFIDDMEDEMDTTAPSGQEAPGPGEEKLAQPNGHSLSDMTTDRSDSTSPYPNDDESFASFVAREANSSVAPLVDEDQSSLSRSPSPAASQPDDEGDGMDPGPIFTTTYVTHFGPTASSPPHPTVIPDNASPAPHDMTLHNFPKRSKYAHRAALSAMHPYHRTRGGGVSAAKTLDLLKAVLQPSLNLKIKNVCDEYLKILSSAAVNMRENTGDSVPEPTLKVLVTKMLEEALHGYQNNKWEFPYTKLPRNDKIMVAKASPMATKKMKGVDPKVAAAKRNRKPPLDKDKASGWKWSMDKRRVDPEKWEPEKLSNETHFVLGVNVNKALGHSANRGKVYYLHPELFKYACDGDDKTWLYENKHLPVHGGKAFLMIFAEIEMLVDMDDVYRDNPEVVAAVRQLQHFTVPQFMLDKMKVFMVSVQGYFAQENMVLPLGMELPPPPGMVLPTDEEEMVAEEKSQ